MKDIAEIIKALAALAWPIVFVYVIRSYRVELTSILGRLKKGKVLGQEIELADSLQKLSVSTAAAEAEVATIATSQPTTKLISNAREDVEQKVLSLVATSPRAALLVLAAEIEREARAAIASSGLLGGRRHVPIESAFGELDARGGLPRHVKSSLRLFWDIRNRLAHGHDTNAGDIISAIDSGIALLRALRAVPHEEHYVAHPGVKVFSDQNLTIPIEGILGLILDVKSPGGARTDSRIFPTTKFDYKRGAQVAWEWSDAKDYGQAWYKDPVDGTTKEAWTSSFAFVGTDLSELR